ncbi:MAG: hypothetical protein A2600_10815 [Candidatus Lambdaproteobacteria bacterium RIFOXYD1_FULL_56_27]|uniref:Formyl transferase C-terminal domain-containing protein n=1 Tax=Candidatus Lambdaproteobacteria bacterium RIFOXYD2_FULL_56_26 TaxID=1817773 RepID=A0A1F6GVK6_9PROT|nr:MAG: hypothetical protein A2426_01635 [Candidatus Lambdaproteobacteria bacterium RIFOXYC1_FULL_56_13]OGH02071.1 MAG: hypothetical protein A2557_10535 [Candidatus Lambdaproteobacteria bacterium RIFOXYD2_FULL_56_26]OGH07721.1 MAG: hypothetical protein A2600_10815 [Candidatus Lambdaproteobacteria bacterium RIFOXYD1_FULL_56_27]
MPAKLRVLFLCSAFNGLTQSVWTRWAGRFGQSRLKVGLDVPEILAFAPDLVLCPYLLERLPPAVFEACPCLVLHPGPHGLGGPSSLQWAVLAGRTGWAVSCFEARKHWDQGPLWAELPLELQPGSVIELYRRQVVPLAVPLFEAALERLFSGAPPLERGPFLYQKKITPQDLRFDWQETGPQILAKIRAGDSTPGTLGPIQGQTFGLFKAQPRELQGPPGEVLGFEGSGVLVGTGTHGLLIERLMPQGGMKLKAKTALLGSH